MIDRIQALRQTALFSSLQSADLEELSRRAVEQTLKKGEILFIAGDAAAGLYVVRAPSARTGLVRMDGSR